MNNTSRDVRIDILRLLFALVIVVHHIDGAILSVSDTGYLAVEFFFFLNGYMFITKDVDKLPSDNFLRVLKKLLPLMIATMIIFVSFEILYFDYTFSDASYIAFYSLIDAFGLNILGFPSPNLNVVLWFVSALIISMAILQIIWNRFGRDSIIQICPLAILLVGIMYEFCGNINGIWGMEHKHYWEIFRGFAGIMMGILIYRLTKKIHCFNLSTTGITMVQLFTVLLVVIIPVLMFNNYIWYEELIVYFLILLMLILIISFPSQNHLFELLTPYSSKIAMLSVFIFLSHSYWTSNIMRIIPNTDHFDAIILVIVLTICTMIAAFFLSKIIGMIATKIRDKMFERTY